MYLFSGLKEQLQTYLDASQVQEVEQSYIFARDAHDGQLRSSGDPYITHPVAVAKILATLHLDHQTIMAALMHDVIEDCEVTRDELSEKFGEQVADLVEGVSKLTQIKFRSREEAKAENFRKMIMAMVEDLRVVLIKLADRLHNMRTLGSLRPDKQRRIAKETIEIYAPIANRLGMYAIRSELEELGFAAQFPTRCRVIRELVKKARGNRKEIVTSICNNIQKRLDRENIDGIVIGREKSPFSIYQKMLEKIGERAQVFESIMDVYGFRVTTDSEDNCYRVLGQLHNLYRPVPGRFKDYIAIPKKNGYQSLHTTLKGPHGLHIEVQVRTATMDQMAENGVAAHWLYKSGSDINRAEIRAREWMRHLTELQKNTGDSLEFIESVKVDLFPGEVYIFTPNGSIIELRKGATPVDFAYAIHTDVGNSCIACKVDGKISALSTELSNGQTVEIITAPGAKPNPGWLSFVTTSKARTNIRDFIKNLRRDDAINLGKRLLEKALGGEPLENIEPDAIERVKKETRHDSFDDILAEIGLGQTASIIIAHRLDPKVETGKKDKDADRPLAIKGTEGMMIEYARCCHPIPGDPIVGMINTSGGFVLHRSDCNNTANHRDKLDKYVSVQWEKDVEGEFRVKLKVEVVNQHGVLAKVTSLIADQGVNIVNIDIDSKDDGATSVINFLINVRNRLHLANIIKKIRLYDFVIRVSRNH